MMMMMIYTHCCKLYAQANAKFSYCSAQFSIFKAYCTPLHCPSVVILVKTPACRSYKWPTAFRGEFSLRVLEEKVLVKCLYLLK